MRDYHAFFPHVMGGSAQTPNVAKDAKVMTFTASKRVHNLPQPSIPLGKLECFRLAPKILSSLKS